MDDIKVAKARPDPWRPRMAVVYRLLRDAPSGCLMYRELLDASLLSPGEQGHSIMLLRSKGVGVTAHYVANVGTCFALTSRDCPHRSAGD